MDRSDLLGAGLALQLTSQKVPKKMVVAEPVVFQVQGNQKEIVRLQSGDETLPIDFRHLPLDARGTQRIAQGGAETIRDGRA